MTQLIHLRCEPKKLHYHILEWSEQFQVADRCDDSSQGLSGEGRRRRRSFSAEKSPDPPNAPPAREAGVPLLRSPSRSPLRPVTVPRAAAYLSAGGSAWSPPAPAAAASPEAVDPGVGRQATSVSPQPFGADARAALASTGAEIRHLNEVHPSCCPPPPPAPAPPTSDRPTPRGASAGGRLRPSATTGRTRARLSHAPHSRRRVLRLPDGGGGGGGRQLLRARSEELLERRDLHKVSPAPGPPRPPALCAMIRACRGCGGRAASREGLLEGTRGSGSGGCGPEGRTHTARLSAAPRPWHGRRGGHRALGRRATRNVRPGVPE